MIDVTVLDQFQRAVSGATVTATESSVYAPPRELVMGSVFPHMTMLHHRYKGVSGTAAFSGVPVTLIPAGRIGIYTDNTTFSSSGGLDLNGLAYSATAIGGPLLAWRGVGFNIILTPINTPDCNVNTVVALPSGNYATLMILATAVNGNQVGQNFVIQYSDGSSETHTRSMSDWGTPQSYAGESVARSMTYRNKFDGTKDTNVFNLYGYIFPLIIGKSAISLTLPANNNVALFSATLTTTLPVNTAIAVYPSSATVPINSSQAFNAVLT